MIVIYMEFLVKGRQHLRLPFLVGCDHLGLFSNQITELFDHLYLWKESIDLLDFCLEIIIK